MLGAVHQVAIPTKLDLAFAILGNAVSVPQSLLALLIGFAVVTDEQIPLLPTVRRIWDDVPTAWNLCAIVEGNFILLLQPQELMKRIPLSWHEEGNGGSLAFDFIVELEGRTSAVVVDGMHRICDLLAQRLLIPSHHWIDVKLEPVDEIQEPANIVGVVRQHSGSWRLFLKGTMFARVCFQRIPSSVVDAPPFALLPPQGNVALGFSKASSCPPPPPVVSPTLAINVLDLHEDDDVLQGWVKKVKLHEATSIIENPRFARDCELEQLEIRAMWNGRTLSADLYITTTELQGRTVDQFVDQEICFAQRVPAQNFRRLMCAAFLLYPSLDPEIRRQTVIICEADDVPHVTHQVTLSAPYTRADFFGMVSRVLSPKFHNNQPFVADSKALCHLDVITYSFETLIRCGGARDHEDCASLTLAAPASLHQRLNFAAQTHGWLATDEFTHIAMWLRWNSADARVLDPIYWELRGTEIIPRGAAPVIAPDRPTFIPVLLSAHWFGIEISEPFRNPTITIVQLSPTLTTQVVAIAARWLQRPVGMVNDVIICSPNPADMCGWTLAFRWTSALALHRVFFLRQHEVENALFSDERLKDVITSSMTAWESSGAPEHLVQFAQHVRIHFLTGLLASPGGAFLSRLDTVAAGLQPGIRGFGVPVEVDYHESLAEYHVRRIDDFLEQPLWLASDELNFWLHLLRVSNPTVGFGPALSWNRSTLTLHSIAGIPFDLRAYDQTFLVIEIHGHWALLSVFRETDQWFFILHSVQQDNATLRALVRAVAHLWHLAPAECHPAPHYLNQPPGFCGWAIIQVLAARFHLVCHPLSPAQRSQIERAEIGHRVQEVLDEMSIAADNVTRGTALRTLAENARAQYLAYILFHKGDHEYCSAGMSDQVSCVNDCLTWSMMDSAMLYSAVSARLAAIATTPLWMGSDEVEIVFRSLRAGCPQYGFLPPLLWPSLADDVQGLSAFCPQPLCFQHSFLLVAFEGHWISVRIQCLASTWIFACSCPLRVAILLVRALATFWGINVESCSVRTFQLFQPPNLCGWAAVLDIMHIAGMPVDCTGRGLHLLAELSVTPGPWISLLASFANGIRHSQAPPVLAHLASIVRCELLLQIAHGFAVPDFVVAGANTDEAKQPQPMQVEPDPLWVADPWKKGPVTKPKSVKWDELQLAKDHPFVAADASVLPQRHRLQVTPTHGGIVFATKGHIKAILDLKPSAPTALLLPVTDKAIYGELASRIEGPFETIVYDSGTSSSYKRLVHMLVVTDKVQYKLAKPVTTIKTDEISELVIEFDSRLSTREVLADLKEHPLPTIRQILARICTSKALEATSLYGFRINSKLPGTQGVNPTPYQVQCVLKTPKASRAFLLEASGREGAFLRDYLHQDAESKLFDTTVVPRFWDLTQGGFQDAVKTTQGLEGHAGLVMTRRGVALRVWISHIAAARRRLLPLDSRLCEDNMSTVPRFPYVSSGWPTEAQAINVIQAIKAATGQAVVPSRAYRQAGVHHWLVMFQEKPTKLSFALKVNDKESEILLSPQASWQPSKGKGKGRTKTGPTVQIGPEARKELTPAFQSAEKDRLDKLEGKFNVLESKVAKVEDKQDHLDHKLDSRFNEIGDQLRQLLQLSHPRDRPVSGETPPPKHLKPGL